MEILVEAFVILLLPKNQAFLIEIINAPLAKFSIVLLIWWTSKSSIIKHARNRKRESSVIICFYLFIICNSVCFQLINNSLGLSR